MSVERTFGIIKPDAVRDNYVGKILSRYEEEGLNIVAGKFLQLSKEKAEGFYIEHQDKSFFSSLVGYMTTNEVFVYVLEGENAIGKNREIMGATNPDDAAEGTLRKLYAKSIESNAVHGSDSHVSAEREIKYFFDKNEIFSRV